MPLQRIQLRPGVSRDTTNFASEGTWWDCDKIRFRVGLPEKIGGWVQAFPDVLDGVVYSLRAWATISPYRTLTGIGTSRKFYVESNNQVFDITPAGRTLFAVNPLATTAGSSIVVVTAPGHNLQEGGSATIRGVLNPVGGIPAVSFNKEFLVDVVDASQFRITVDTVASSTATGGGAPEVRALAPSAVDIVEVARGWGAGPWNAGGYGDAYIGSTLPAKLPNLWSQDNLGSDLVICPRGGQIYYWEFRGGGGFSRPAKSLLEIANLLPLQDPQPDNTWIPSAANIALFDARSEILIAVGVNPGPFDLAIDPMFVRWSDESDVYDWEPRVTNRAGGKRLASGSQLVSAVRVKENTLILSDTTVFSMQFVGGEQQFTIEPLYEGITIQGPNAITVIGGAAYWMGDKIFYKYDGSLTPIDCPIKDLVFDNISTIRGSQVTCGYNERFNEIWWYYCAQNDLTPSRYVIYNYEEKVWSYGTLARTAWSAQQFANRPYAGVALLGADLWGRDKYTSNVVIHEVGTDDAATGTPVPINAFIESADFDIGEGHVYSFVSKMLPDVRFDKSTSLAPELLVAVTGRSQPGGSYQSQDTNRLATQQTVVDRYTEQIDYRMRERQIRMRIESSGLGVQWRWGVPRFDIRPDGRRGGGQSAPLVRGIVISGAQNATVGPATAASAGVTSLLTYFSSYLYPLLVGEQFNSQNTIPLNGSLSTPPLEAFNSQNFVPLTGGTLITTLRSYTNGAIEAFNSGMTIPLTGGTLVLTLRTYTNGAIEAFNSAITIPLTGGTLVVVLQTYTTGAIESFNSQNTIPLSGGTLA